MIAHQLCDHFFDHHESEVQKVERTEHSENRKREQEAKTVTPMGFEPTTFRSGVECSTVEPQSHLLVRADVGRGRNWVYISLCLPVRQKGRVL